MRTKQKIRGVKKVMIYMDIYTGPIEMTNKNIKKWRLCCSDLSKLDLMSSQLVVCSLYFSGGKGRQARIETLSEKGGCFFRVPCRSNGGFQKRSPLQRLEVEIFTLIPGDSRVWFHFSAFHTLSDGWLEAGSSIKRMVGNVDEIWMVQKDSKKMLASVFSLRKPNVGYMAQA